MASWLAMRAAVLSGILRTASKGDCAFVPQYLPFFSALATYHFSAGGPGVTPLERPVLPAMSPLVATCSLRAFTAAQLKTAGWLPFHRINKALANMVFAAARTRALPSLFCHAVPVAILLFLLLLCRVTRRFLSSLA